MVSGGDGRRMETLDDDDDRLAQAATRLLLVSVVVSVASADAAVAPVAFHLST